MQKLKTVFFGTHEFAATILKELLASDFLSIDLVLTQPDRKVGRKQVIEESPVKKLASARKLSIDQPESLKNYSLHFTPDLNIVAQYGLIMPKKIVESPKFGSINVHGSLLPKYRGASPIQMAIVNGEKETGITIMQMDEKMDHGPILTQKSLPIDEDDNYTALSHKMAVMGSKLLIDTIPKYVSGIIKPQPQEGEPTFTKLLSKEDGMVDFKKTTDEIYNQYRGLTPWPGIWTTWNGKRIKLLKISKSNTDLSAGRVTVDNKKIFIGCSVGSIEILELQLEGKNPMDAKAFLNGFKNFDGTNLL